ncbi:MAG: DNA glycosylase AlkZ-like family protein [Candidatus Asgardarchaeia archaeon]
MGIKYAQNKYTDEEVLKLFSPVIREWFTRNFKKLTPPQQYAFPYIHKGKNVLIFSPTGSGKCITPDQKVLVKINGLVRLLKSDDLIQMAKSEGTPLLKIDNGVLYKVPTLRVFSLKENKITESPAFVYIEKYKGEIIEIETTAGRKIKVTPNHPLLKENSDGSWEWVPAGKLKTEDRIAVAREINYNTSFKNLNFNLDEALEALRKKFKMVLTYEDYLSLKQKIAKVGFKGLSLEELDRVRIFCRLTYTKVAKKACIGLSTVWNFFRGKTNYGKNLILKTLKESFPSSMDDNRIFVVGKEGSITSFKYPKVLDERVVKWVAFILSEGHIQVNSRNEDFIDFIIVSQTKNMKLLREFLTITRELFDISFKRKDKTSWVLNSRMFLEFISAYLDLQPNSREKRKKMPKWILSLDKSLMRIFLKWFFTLEADIRNKIVLFQASEDIIDEITYMLLRFGIFPSLSEKFKFASNTAEKRKRKYYSVSIFGTRNINKFHQEIGLERDLPASYINTLKAKPSGEHIGKFYLDLREISEIRRIFGYSWHDEFEKRYGNIYEAVRRSGMITINTAEKLQKLLIQDLQKTTSDGNIRLLESLRRILNSDVFFLKIKKIRRVHYDGELLDFTVPDLANFVGGKGAVIYHNTLAAFLSIINELFLLGERGELEDKVYCVYISPLRALSNDISRNLEQPLKEIKKLAEEKGMNWPEIRKAIRTGDTSTYERSKMLRTPPHILITTPESLALMINAPKFREKLKNVRWVIVDEVHELSDNKRGVHLSLSLERLQNYVEKEFVRIGLSATQAPIEEIAKWLVGYKDDGTLRDITIVNVYFTKELDIKVLSPVTDLSAVSYESATESMYHLIKELVKQHRTTLIFTNTRSGTERVSFKLKELLGDEFIDQLGAHHGSLSKVTRLDVEERLKRGEMRAVVCVTGDSKVLTNNSWKKIKEINPNDKIIYLDEQLKLREGKFNGLVSRPYYGNGFAIKSQLGFEIKCTKEHKFLTIRDSKIKWVEAKDLKVGDYVAVIRKIPNSQHKVPYYHEFISKDTYLSLEKTLATSDILWDKITEKKPIKLKKVYSLVDTSNHNYVIEGFICRNSSSSLELGIDIGYIDLVIQIGSPKSIAKGLQRIGRAGHALDKPSKGRLIVFDRDDVIECAVLVKSAYDGKIDRVQIPKNALDVLAQHIVGMSLEKKWTIEEAYNLVRRSYNYHNLPKEDFINVIKYLAGFYSDLEERQVYRKIWYDETEGVFGRKASSRMIYYLNIGTIPDEADYTVVLERLRTPLGHLSESFVERLSPGDVFVLGGKTYLFKRLSGTRVIVAPAEGRRPTVPSWVGEMLPRSFDLSVDIGEFRETLSEKIKQGVPDEELIKWLVNDFRVDKNAAVSIINYFKEQLAFAGIVPSHRKIIIEEYYDARGRQNIIFHAGFGRRVVDALSRAYAFVISNKIKGNVSTTITDNGFMLTLPFGKTFDLEKIKDLIAPDELEYVLKRAIRNTELFNLRFRHCATRSFMVLRKYRGHSISVSRQSLRAKKVLTALEMHPNFPVLKETYREILEDLMDIHNARQVLQWISEGKSEYIILRSGTTPSPFAHSLILTGAEDVVLMEDRDLLLKELHRQVLEKVLTTTESKSLFAPELIDSIFLKRQYLTEDTKGSSKEDIIKILKNIGPLYLFREQRPSIFERMKTDKDTIKKWCKELLTERKIISMRLPKGDPMWIAIEDYPIFVSGMKLNLPIGELEKRVLELLTKNKEMTSLQLGRSLNLKYADLRPVLKRLEHMFLISKSRFVESPTGEEIVVWTLTENLIPDKLQKIANELDRDKAIQELILRYLRTYGPSTALEVATWLGKSENETKIYLNTLERLGLIYSGFYTPLKPKPQYLRAEDRELLKELENKKIGVESISPSIIIDFVLKKQFLRKETQLPPTPESVVKILKTLGPVQTARAFWSRIRKYTHKLVLDLQSDRKITVGRFWRGKICYALTEHVPWFIAINRGGDYTLSKAEEKILEIIKRKGPILKRDIVKESGYSKTVVNKVLENLEKKLFVLRYIYRKSGMLDFSKYIATQYLLGDELTIPSMEDAAKKIIELFIRGHGPVPVFAISWATKLPMSIIEPILHKLEGENKIVATRISSADSTYYYMTADDFNILKEMQKKAEMGQYSALKNEIKIVSSLDPYSWRRAKQELKEAYGSSWGSIVLLDGNIVGAFEWSLKQEKLHIPNLKLSSILDGNKEALIQLAKELISLSKYFGASTIEIEEINGLPSAKSTLSGLVDTFLDNEFQIVENRLVRTSGVGIAFSRQILQKWAVRHFLFHPSTRPTINDLEYVVKKLFRAWFSCLIRRLPISNWDTLWEKINELVKNKRLFFVAGGVIHMDDLPIWYHVLREEIKLDNIDNLVLDVIDSKGPISRQEIYKYIQLDRSTIDRSLQKLQRSYKVVRVYQDSRGTIKYWTFDKWIPIDIQNRIKKLDEYTAKKEFVYRWIHALGMRTINHLYGWMDGIISQSELHALLTDLEDEGRIVSGYLYEGRKEIHYMTQDDFKNLLDFSQKIPGSKDNNSIRYTFTVFGYPRISYFFDEEIHNAFGSTPGWLIFINENVAASVVSHKKQPVYIVHDLKILPEFMNKESISLIVNALEKSVKARGFSKIIIKRINGIGIDELMEDIE